MAGPFVGREGALDRVMAAIAAVREGPRAAVVGVVGGPGLGKTRFLAEAVGRARRAGFAVAQAACGWEPDVPYAPFLTLVAALPPEAAPEAPLDAPPPDDFEARLRAREALVGAIAAATGPGLVLAIDGFDHADEASRAFLPFLLARLADRPLAIVLSAGVLPAEAPATVALEPLSGPALAAMVTGLLALPAPPPAAFLAQLAELTGGVPAAVAAAVQHLVDAGLVPWADGGYRPRALAPAELPGGLHALIAERLSGLAPLSRGLLQAVAVLGREVDLDVLRRMFPDDAAAALHAELATLERAGMLAREGDRWAVGATHLADALLEALSPANRRALHTRGADALEAAAVAAGRVPYPAGLVLRLAHHHLAGERGLVAARFALDAARLTAAHAGDEALDLLTRGHARLREAGFPDPRLRLDLAMMLADRLRIRGDAANAETHHLEALELAVALGRPAEEARQHVDLAILAQLAGRHAVAKERLAEALARAEALDQPREVVRGLLALGRSCYQLGDVARAEAAPARALALAEATGDHAAVGEALAFLGLLAVTSEPGPDGPARVAEGLDRLRQAIAIKERLGDRLGLNDALMLLGNALLATGELAGAEAAFRRNQALSAELGSLEDEVVAAVNLGLVALERGDGPSAADAARHALALAGDRGNFFLAGLAGCVLARADMDRAPEAGFAVLHGHLDAFRADANPYGELFALVHLAEAARRLGRADLLAAMVRAAEAARTASGIREFDRQLAALAQAAGRP